MIARRSTLLLMALTLCLALVAGSPAASLSAGNSSASAAKKKCKKGAKLKKKKCVPAKKKATKPASNVPADGIYAGDKINLVVATKAGKRFVKVSASIPLTCTPSNTTSSRTLSVRDMPITGTAFQGTFSDAQFPEFGATTATGTFLSATRVHVTAQTAHYKNGQEDCNGSLDVTTNLRKGY